MLKSLEQISADLIIAAVLAFVLMLSLGAIGVEVGFLPTWGYSWLGCWILATAKQR